jgi:hypothetical protein
MTSQGFDVKAYRAFLNLWQSDAHRLSAEDLLAELWDAMVKAEPTIQATDYSLARGWRLDISHGTATALIKPHVWLQGAKKWWDPTIDLMSDFERSTFSSRRVKVYDNAVEMCRSAERRVYVLGDDGKVTALDEQETTL